MGYLRRWVPYFLEEHIPRKVQPVMLFSLCALRVAAGDSVIWVKVFIRHVWFDGEK